MFSCKVVLDVTDVKRMLICKAALELFWIWE